MRKSTQSKKSKPLLNTLADFFIRSWWVVLFILCCYFGYEQELLKKDHDFAMLQTQYDDLLQKNLQAKAHQEDLLRQINSQSDPAYVELILMKGLGLAPEGQTKVLFTNHQELLESQKSKVR